MESPDNQTEEVLVEPLADQLPSIADWLPDAWVPFWELLAEVPIVAGVVVAIVSFVLALLVRHGVVRLVQPITRFTRSEVDDEIVANLQKPVFTTVLFFGLTLAVAVSQLPFGAELIIQLLLSVIVASWMRSAFRVSTAVLDGLGRQSRFSFVEERTVPIFDLSAKLLIILIGSYVLLLIWGINPVGWLASAGIVGIAVGFAAKDTLANLFSGFFIVADAPYKIGDYINLDSGERGKVSAIGLRSTRLITRDDVEVTIPNGVIANAKIVNESGGPHLKMRTRLSVGVAYGSDVDRVCEVLLHVARSHPEVCGDPEPRVRMIGFGASSLDFDLLVWMEDPELRGRIRHDLFMQIYKAFAAEGIEIPFAQQDVYIKELPGT
jgi:MscS family membrane protein